MSEIPESKLILTPIVRPPKPFTLGAFDIEGVGGPGGFVSGAILTDNDYQQFSSALDMMNYFRLTKFKGARFFAHNLRYDFGILERYLTEQDYPLLINGRPFKVSIAQGKKNPRYWLDSWLFSSSLALKTIGDAIGLPKYPTPPELLQSNADVPEWHCDEHNRLWCVDCYLKRDVEIVLEYMSLFQNTINKLGGQLKWTLASTAMDLFRRGFLKQEYRTPFKARNDYARHAYYGGRTEAFRLGQWENVNVYDINSLYPFVMAHREYPDPNYLHGPLQRSNLSFIEQYEGVSEVTITVPPMYLPPLPKRQDGKLFFPIGTWQGHYSHVELRKALELGATIHQVHSTLYSEKTCSPFKEYVHTLYNYRQELKANRDPRQLVIKILLNSLYGKFGQRDDGTLQEIRSFVWWYFGNQHIPVTHREIDGWVTVLVGKQFNRQPIYVNVLWAVYITSYARLELYRYMQNTNGNLLYSDTDSVFTTTTLKTSSDLGGMKQEYANVDVEIFGPKAYILTLDDMVIIEKCKGVPTEQAVRFLLEGRATFSRPVGLLEAGKLRDARGNHTFYPSAWRDVTKVYHETYPKRKLIPVSLPQEGHFETFPHWVADLPQEPSLQQ